MKIAQKYIKQWEADWRKLKAAGDLPKGYASSRPMSMKEYVQRNINKLEFADKNVNKQIKELKRQVESSESKLEKQILKEELEKAKFYKEAIKTAVKKREPEKAAKYAKEAAADIKVDYTRLKEDKRKKKEAPKSYKKNDDIYFRFLGISKHETVTLSDGSRYSQADLEKALKKKNISLKKEFFKDDISKIKYSSAIYNKFSAGVEGKLNNRFGGLSRLTGRDLEGMKKLIGFEGVNASLKYK